MLRTLLVPVDLSPATDRVLGRVALLPVADRARVVLLHVVPQALPPRDRRRAKADAKKALAAEATELALALPKGVDVRPIVKVGVPAAEIASHAEAVAAELVVMGRGGGRTLRDVFLGSTAERVIRRGQLPVLVVRIPARGRYRRPALALDLDQAADVALELLLRVVPPPRPRVGVIHAFEVPYQGMIYPSLSDEDAEEFRDHDRAKATREIEKVLATAVEAAKLTPGDAPSWTMQLRFGSPRTVIENAVRRGETDLLVLGTRGRAGIAHALLGTVAGDVLRAVSCDVLVVPPRSPKRG